MSEARYCEECFIRWRDGAAECWHCGGHVALTHVEANALIAEATRLDQIARWGERAKNW